MTYDTAMRNNPPPHYHTPHTTHHTPHTIDKATKFAKDLSHLR
jgi:hypothetical protein